MYRRGSLPLNTSLFQSRTCQIVAALLFFLFVLDLRNTYKQLHKRGDKSITRALSRTERVFISAIQYNSADLLRSHWNKAILDLCVELGPSNVYFSTYESGSTDDTRDALLELDEDLSKLNVQRSIVVDGWTRFDEMSFRAPNTSYIEIPTGYAARRIPYLAHLRNLALAPLEWLAEEGQIFDRVLFLNDIVFTAEDALQVLDTNNGDYAAACALDFLEPPRIYDTFALLDIHGGRYWSGMWPYFRASKSTNAMIRKEPVPLKSCWSGLAAFDATPFTLRDKPLRFRAIAASLAQLHVEASECCLIHVDNPLSATRGVYLNPNVRVTYSPAFYDAARTMDDSFTLFRMATSLWWHRITRLVTAPIPSIISFVVHPRIKRWEQMSPDNHEPGEFCLLNEMQILTDDGWDYVRGN